MTYVGVLHIHNISVIVKMKGNQLVHLAIFEHKQSQTYLMVVFDAVDSPTPVAVKQYSNLRDLIDDVFLIKTTKAINQLSDVDQSLLNCYVKCCDEYELEACFGLMIMMITEEHIDFNCNTVTSEFFCDIVSQLCDSKLGPYIIGASLKLV